MSNTYNIEKKKKMAERIHMLTNKDQLKMIKKIIVTNNADLEFTRNGNGLFAQFQSLNTETYVEIEKLLNKIDKLKMKKMESELEDTDAQTSEINAMSHSDNIFIKKKK